MEPKLSPEEYQRYSRNLLLPEVGLDGQLKLKDASVLIVGLGGLGSPAALYLAAAGVGRIGLADYDAVELSNLQRQILHATQRVGKQKAHSAASHLKSLNPDIQLDAIDTVINVPNAIELLSPYQVVIDASDNFATRYLLNDACFFLKKPLVHGSVHRFEGQASVFNGHTGPCYRCVFPAPPPPELVPSCAEIGILGVVPGLIGVIQASETIKWILGIDSPLQGSLMICDLLRMNFQQIRLRKNTACPLCGTHPSITQLDDEETFSSTRSNDKSSKLGIEASFISATALDKLLHSGRKVIVLDVREPHELKIASMPEAINVPYSRLSSGLERLDKSAEIVTVCRTGERSHRAMHLLRAAGFTQTRCLEGGINAWAAQIDRNLPQY